ncbi:hypothetical protein ACFLYP_04525, partial [Chloroflexota bacterium]
MAEQITRKEAPPGSTWTPEKYFPTWKDWEAEYQQAVEDLPKLAAFNGKLKDGPGSIADFIEELSTQIRPIYRLYIFAYYANAVDGEDQDAKAYMGQGMGLLGRAMATISFSDPELLEIGEKLMEWAEGEPKISEYQHYFENLLRRKEHTRSAEVEEVLGMLAEPFGLVENVAS